MKHELLTLWFLRLNGYFCVPNFIVHPDAPGPQRTDADILAVRFPYCREVAGAPMPQDDSFVVSDRIDDFLITEVKTGECRLNGPWAAPGRGNVQYVLKWMGFLKNESRLEETARALYQQKRWNDPEGIYSVRMVCFGESVSKAPGMREVIQRTHLKSAEFVHDRFRRFDTRKADRRQWDDFIRHVFKMVDMGASVQQILEWVDT